MELRQDALKYPYPSPNCFSQYSVSKLEWQSTDEAGMQGNKIVPRNKGDWSPSVLFQAFFSENNGTKRQRSTISGRKTALTPENVRLVPRNGYKRDFPKCRPCGRYGFRTFGQITFNPNNRPGALIPKIIIRLANDIISSLKHYKLLTFVSRVSSLRISGHSHFYTVLKSRNQY